MRRLSFVLLLGLLLSLGTVELCSAQQNPFNFGPEIRGWENRFGEAEGHQMRVSCQRGGY